MAWLLHFYYVHKAVAAVEIQTEPQLAGGQKQLCRQFACTLFTQACAHFIAQAIAGLHHAHLFGSDRVVSLHCAWQW